MKIAIIGFGPRGLAAAETLLAEAHGPIDIDIFDPCPWPAAGPNFAPDEARTCLLNLPLREIDLPDPGSFEFPRFDRWLDHPDPDHYPPRADLGAYLTARFEALRTAHPGTLTVRHEAVTAARSADGGWLLTTSKQRHGPYDEVLLSPGQPQTAPGNQMSRWRSHASVHKLPLFDAYPTSNLRSAAGGWTQRTVAIRGLGLSSLDVIALLTLDQGGRMGDGVYHPSGREPARILPFSLDGLPPAPKPVMGEDSRYDLRDDEVTALQTALVEALQMDPEDGLCHLTDALIDPARRITGADAKDWLNAERDAPGSQDDSDPLTALDDGIAMARGKIAPSIGYAIGQIWRRWQSELRDTFRKTASRGDTRLAVLGFDNGLKRYSYGPPVQSAELLRALIAADIVALTIADDPDIEMQPDGWRMDDKTTAHVMIDGVLPSPDLAGLTDPLITMLSDAEVLTSVADGGGAHVNTEARVIDATGVTVPGLSLLGRLTEGSTIATDSIHDCFGPATRAWAQSVARVRDAEIA